MKYLVMECHSGYAVVLDTQGRFLRVANQHFTVGQTVDAVIELQQSKPSLKPVLRSLAAVAACLCLIAVGAWQMLMPYGAVRLKINPDVKLNVNRLGYVIDIIPLNTDGTLLLEGYDPGRKKVDLVLDELTDRAMDMGYLTANGNVQVTVESQHKNWRIATQDRLIAELGIHTGGTVIVIPSTTPIPADDDFDNDKDDDGIPDDLDEDFGIDRDDDEDDIEEPDDDDDDRDDMDDRDEDDKDDPDDEDRDEDEDDKDDRDDDDDDEDDDEDDRDDDEDDKEDDD